MIIPPYGGELVDLFVTRERHAELCARATGLPRVCLRGSARCLLKRVRRFSESQVICYASWVTKFEPRQQENRATA
jgi:hypothetical protein